MNGRDTLTADLVTQYAFLSPGLAQRLVRSYGTAAATLLDGVQNEADLGLHFGAGLYQREVEYLVRREWARTVDDILWRRTKLGLRFSRDEANGLAAWLETNLDAKVTDGR